MIVYSQGDLLAHDAEVLVNTVNCVGVMGKGIALAFKKAHPGNFEAYRMACDEGRLRPGGIFVTKTQDLFATRWILNLATKDDWRDGSRIEWIEAGLAATVAFLAESGASSIAVPALGCSNGGLSWTAVRPLIENAFGALDVKTTVFPPR